VFTSQIRINDIYDIHSMLLRGRRGRDLMVVGFPSTYVISAYYH